VPVRALTGARPGLTVEVGTEVDEMSINLTEKILKVLHIPGPVGCSVCGGDLVIMGSMGSRTFYRCRYCGADHYFDEGERRV
jgi:tRNA(Ile2) C34 agmatinyltransferase TiaS